MVSEVLKKALCSVLLFLLLCTSARAEGDLLDRPFRGISLMQCFASAEQCRALCDLLYSARLKRNAINFISDGTFGLNFESLRYCVDRLTSEGRKLRTWHYAHSGPAARAYRDYKRNPGWAAGLDAATINRRIVFDPKFQESYRTHVRLRIRPAVEYVIASGGIPTVTWLEDNFTTDAFVWFYYLTWEVLQDLPVHYSRNHVHRFAYIPPGVEEERHSFDPGEEIYNGMTFNDGFEVRFLWQKPRDSEFSLADLAEVQQRSGERGNAHINWFGQYQGSGNRDPIRRTFRLPREDEKVEIVRLLRSE